MKLTAVLLAVAGGVLIWSATHGASISGTVRELLAGSAAHPAPEPAAAAAPSGNALLAAAGR